MKYIFWRVKRQRVELKDSQILGTLQRCYSVRKWAKTYGDIDGFVEDCSNSSAFATELLQYCIKLSMCYQ